ncbi:MAG: serine/threonine protein kinase [Lachnospiraceae bacterium]|nr:serine/threonine protein kinase [Lachnospiraceae bacterium]
MKGWNIIEKIGKGSFGTVYKVKRDQPGADGQAVYGALKVLEIPQDEDELRNIWQEYDNEESVRTYISDLKEDYLREIEMMISLRGEPNIVHIEGYEVEPVGEYGWRISICMEYLQDFWQYAKAHPMTEKETIRLALDICDALICCEERNIIHRDIKPANLFYSPEGRYKLGDFGVARMEEALTGTYSVKGTFPYMAPEVFWAEHYDSTVDIYSLGIVLYRLMNRSRLPFENIYKPTFTYREKEEALRRRMKGEAFQNPVDASEAFAAVIMRSCAFPSKERYQGAREMKADLLAIAEEF